MRVPRHQAVRAEVCTDGKNRSLSARNVPRDDPAGDDDAIGAPGTPGTPTGFACPRCGGVLGENRGGPDRRLRCRTGHAFTIAELDEAQRTAVEDALWAAIRALEEKAAFARRLGERDHRHHDLRNADRHRREARAAERRAGVVRDLLQATEDLTDRGTGTD